MVILSKFWVNFECLVEVLSEKYYVKRLVA